MMGVITITVESLNIMVIEDNPGDLRWIKELINVDKNINFNLECFEYLSKGLKNLNEQDFGLILLDLTLPDSKGIETLLKTLEVASDIPIVVLTGTKDEDFAIELVKKGAQDYLNKDKVDSISLIRSIRYAIKRKRMELELLRTKNELSLILESSSELISYQNNELKMVWANKAAAESVDLNQEQLVGRHCYEIWAQRSNPCVDCPVLEAIKSGSSQKTERSTPDGRSWIIRASPVKNTKGDVIGAVEITLEITERKKAEQKLRKSEEKYRNYIDNAPDGIFIIDRLGNYIEVNKAASKITGFSEDELLKKSIPDIVAPESMEESRKLFSKIMATGKSSGDVLIKKKDDSKCYVFVDCVKLAENKFIGFHKDITERKKAEQQLKVSEEKYYQAYNLANFYKDLFAHDMNNILQNILSSIEVSFLYHQKGKKYSDMKELLDIARDQVLRGANLISNVQKLSQLEETKIITQPTELDIYLKEAINNIQENLYEKEINIRNKPLDQKIIVQGNDLLLVLFENILTNAVKYNKNKIVEIYIKMSKMKKEGVKYIKLEFIDNGIGVSDECKEIIFRKGYKKDQTIKGMGLGLSLVKKIVIGYKGEIWVEDRVQGGLLKGK